jgi:hypothetical protein
MPVSFVYQKSSRSKPRAGADVCEIKCKKLSCAIQKCISRLPATRSRTSASTVNFDACAPAIERYDACCAAVRAADARGRDDDDAKRRE